MILSLSILVVLSECTPLVDKLGNPIPSRTIYCPASYGTMDRCLRGCGSSCDDTPGSCCENTTEPTISAMGNHECGIGDEYQCHNTSSPCPEGQVCGPKLDENGRLAPGTKCIPAGCKLLAQSSGSPPTFALKCFGDDVRAGLDGAETCRVGGPQFDGDPVAITTRETALEYNDVVVPSLVFPVIFKRTFNSSDDAWDRFSSLGTAATPYVPLPYGAELNSRDWTMKWWHNWYSFVWAESSVRWQVRLPGGELVTFVPCVLSGGQTSCTAATTSNSGEARARLVWSTAGGNSFTYYAVSGRQYVYASPHGSTRYFLSGIKDRVGQRSLATVSYAVPAGCGAKPGMQPTTGVPFVSSVSTAEGQNIFFAYSNKGPYPRGTAGYGNEQCVLKSLSVGRTAPGTPAVEYTYDDNASYAPPADMQAGRVIKTTYHLLPAAGAPSVQTIVYPTSGGTSLRVHYGTSTTQSLAATKHVVATPTKYVSESWVGVGGNLEADPELAFTSSDVATSCPPNTSCIASSAFETGLQHRNRTYGDGANQQYSETTAAVQVLTSDTPARRSAKSMRPAAIPGLDTSVGQQVYEFGTTTNGPYNSKVSGSRSDTIISASAVPNSPHIAVNSVTVGRAPDPTMTTSYQYAYIGSPVTQQLVSMEERNSVVPTVPAEKARTHYQYDTDGRLKAVIREGWTRYADGAPQSTTWTDHRRFIGTFYFSTDGLGRTTEVHGPCKAVDQTSADCESPPYPLTRIEYHATMGNEYRRIKTVTRYPNGLAGLALTTTYSVYNSDGNPTTILDENSIPATYAYEANRPVTMTISGKTWSYAYDRGYLTRVQRPLGDNDVICYRRLASTASALANGCDPAENPSNEPTAIFRYGNGSSGGSWYEATILTYGRDGELREEAVYQAGNTTTPFRRTTRERNPLGFTTFEKTGPVPSGTAERTTRQFAADGLVTAQSTPYFAATHFCGSAGAPEELCTKFGYWNTGRLKQMTVKPLPNANDISVCLDYDARGNVTGVKPGCTTTGMQGYVWDDFGNVIQATLVDPYHPIRFEYDPRGNLIRKGVYNRYFPVTLEWDYDQLNRPTQAREDGTIVWKWLYDTDPAQSTNLPAGCTGPVVPLAKTTGRLVWAQDSVWRTWYSYDDFGRVIREARVNVAGNSCSNSQEFGLHQSFERSFTGNGSELTVTYPSGRTVTNTYDATQRVSGMTMTTWNASSWSAPPGTTVAQNVTWFPGGNLKSYDLVTRTTLGGAPSTVTVSYRYGATGDLATDVIPSTACPTAEVDANGMGDSSGRLRAVYVTRGGTNMLRIFYRWKGEQLIEQSRCYLNSTTPEWEYFVDRTGADPAFQYDRAGRLGGGNIGTNFGTNGGYGYKRAFSYDTRGNRSKVAVYLAAGTDSYFSDSSRPDLLSATVYNDGTTSNPLMGWARNSAGVVNVGVYSGRNRSYEYDFGGRLMYMTGTNGSTNWNISFNGAFNSTGVPVTGSESVLRAATLWDTASGNQSFNYYYDAQNRRIRKQYPSGDVDGYFWDAQKRLLMETAREEPANGASTRQAMDEYLWLGQRPILMLRSTYNLNGNAWDRDRADWSAGTCLRRGEGIECRPYGLVTDYLGKPVLTFDSANRIAGVLEYDPYGVVNRTSHWGEIAPASNGCQWVTYGMSQGTSPLSRQMRTHLPRVEVDTPGCIYQYVGNSGTPSDTACGSRWNHWAPWQSVANGSSMHLLYCSNSTANPNPQPFGVSVDGYEYKEYESGATPYIPPFRFPGQYFDPETDLNENWNRYYDPSTGRYLSPEPLLQSPTYVRRMAQSGMSVPTYSYAANNPISYVDPSGLAIMGPLTPEAFEALRIARLTEEGARIVSALEAAPQLFSFEAASLESGTFGMTIPSFNAAGQLSSARMLLDFAQISSAGPTVRTPADVACHEGSHTLDYLRVGRNFLRLDSERRAYDVTIDVRFDLMRVGPYRGMELLGPAFFQSVPPGFIPQRFRGAVP